MPGRDYTSLLALDTPSLRGLWQGAGNFRLKIFMALRRTQNLRTNPSRGLGAKLIVKSCYFSGLVPTPDTP